VNLYSGTIKVKDGGYREDDMVSSGGYYDVTHKVEVYASSRRFARSVLTALALNRYPDKACVVGREIILLLEDV